MQGSFLTGSCEWVATAIGIDADAARVIAATVTALLALTPVFEMGVTVPSSTVLVTAWITLGLGLVAPLVSYWYAVRRFDAYTQ